MVWGWGGWGERLVGWLAVSAERWISEGSAKIASLEVEESASVDGWDVVADLAGGFVVAKSADGLLLG